MAVQQTQSPYKAEFLLSEGAPEKFVEIVHGELIVSEPPGWYHNKVADRFLFILRDFSKTRDKLEFCGDNDGFLLRRAPDLLYSPDAALFYRRPLPPKNQPWREFCPELVVEVNSPSSTKREIVHKCQDYMDAGAEQVWLIDPVNETAAIYFRDGRRILANSKDTIQCEGIAEGLEIHIGSLFKE